MIGRGDRKRKWKYKKKDVTSAFHIVLTRNSEVVFQKTTTSWSKINFSDRINFSEIGQRAATRTI